MALTPVVAVYSVDLRAALASRFAIGPATYWEPGFWLVGAWAPLGGPLCDRTALAVCWCCLCCYTRYCSE